MKKYILTLFSFLALLSIEATSIQPHPNSLEDALEKLDIAISQREKYIQLQLHSIDSLKLLTINSNATQLPQIYSLIGDNYRRCNIDSALYYYQKGINAAQAINDTEQAQYISLSYVAILPIQGVIKEAIEIYDSIATYIYPRNKMHLYETGNRLFYFASSFYPIDKYSDYYATRALESTDSLVRYIDKSSIDIHLYNAQLFEGQNNIPMMIAELQEVIDSTDINTLAFARAVSHLAEYYNSKKGKNEDHMYYLALASLSDIYSGTLEGTALQKLGVALYNQGNISQAYKYLALSLDNAVKSGSRIRALQSAEAYPIISKSFKAQDEAKLTWLTWLVIALIIALTIIAGSLFFLRKKMKILTELKTKLSQANVTKDTYISQFLSLSSLYIEKLEEFHKIAKRKLKANQVADLYNLLESEKMLDEQSQIFYRIFDNAFIHIYPTFVTDVNKLIFPEKRFNLPEMKLNTELRILAFSRLGIDDSEQIARFLGLSLNTIYTYRNRLKGKAINRDQFDADVMKIGEIS